MEEINHNFNYTYIQILRKERNCNIFEIYESLHINLKPNSVNPT